MSSVWLPGLIVLAVGLAAGWLLAARLRRQGRPQTGESLRLKIADLEARRDELYRRLRTEEVTEDERGALELAAARVLRELEDLAPEAAASARPPAVAPPARRTPPAARRGRWTGVIGFVSGLAAAGLLGMLIYWAGRDATPDPQAPAPMREAGSAAGALPPDHPPIEGQEDPERAARLADLEQRVAADADDLMALKELALEQLAAGRYFDAFQRAGELLERIPEDPDGLFVRAVVRLAMGQNVEAVDLFDRILARFPNHMQAMAYRGLALYQEGRVEAAVDTWEMGRDMAAGADGGQFDALLAMASGEGGPPGVAVPPADRPDAPAAEAAPTATAPAPTAVASDVYQVRVDLAPGARAVPGAVLFVFLRPAEGGPPIAVRRIDSPRFPLEVDLGAADSMMGAGELPAGGRIVARLDADGSATSRSLGDLAAEADAALGSRVELALSGD